MSSQQLLQKTIQPIDIKAFNVVDLVDAMSQMGFQARNFSFKLVYFVILIQALTQRK